MGCIFKKMEKLNILEIEADQLSEYCREFGLITKVRQRYAKI